MNKINTRILSTIFKYLKTRPTFESVGIKPYRQLLEKSAAAFKPDPSVEFSPFSIGSIPAQWIYPSTSNDATTLLYVHGGGYIAGSMNSHKDLASRIAVAGKSKLLIFNYRLAPEHPFPAGLDDVKTIYKWLLDHTGTHGSICLIGDSAGGGLVLALMSDLLQNKEDLPACAVLMSPWIDLACKNRSHTDNAESDPMLGPDVLKKTARLYTDQDVTLPLISPINNDFTGLCPMLIQVGENEVLLDDSRLLAEKIEGCDADVTLEIWDDMFHVWQYFARYLGEGRQAIEKIGLFIQKHCRSIPG